jgi:hypothetical protein
MELFCFAGAHDNNRAIAIGGAASHMVEMTTSLAARSTRPHTSAAIGRWDSDRGAADFSRDKAEAAPAADPSAGLREASSRLKAYDPLLEEGVMGFIGADEAALWQDVNLDDFMGTTHVGRGVYHVSLLHNDEGEEDGVQLRRRDVPGRMISLSQDQYMMLANMPFFEKR